MARALNSIEKIKGDNDDQNVGVNIARKAFEAPLRQIVTVVGGETLWSSLRLEEVKMLWILAANGDYGDMIEMGIWIQPKY